MCVQWADLPTAATLSAALHGAEPIKCTTSAGTGLTAAMTPCGVLYVNACVGARSDRGGAKQEMHVRMACDVMQQLFASVQARCSTL